MTRDDWLNMFVEEMDNKIGELLTKAMKLFDKYEKLKNLEEVFECYLDVCINCFDEAMDKAKTEEYPIVYADELNESIAGLEDEFKEHTMSYYCEEE